MWTIVLKERWAIVLLIVVLVGAVSLALLVATKGMQNMMQVSGLSATQFEAAALGEEVEFVLEVTDMPSGEQLIGRLLESSGEGDYRRTSGELTISLSSDARIMMGQSSDVAPGAILQVGGIKDDGDHVTAARLVILTGYLTIR